MSSIAESQHLDPDVLARIEGLELASRQIVDGLVSGRRRSPQRGFSVEFAEHRQYAPGDEIRHIDWKVFGKSEKLYLKLYEQETNLVCNILLDASESMAYRSDQAGQSKFDYAATAAVSLAHLVLRQQEMVGFALFEDEVRHLLPASSQLTQLRQILHLAGSAKPGAARSRVGETLEELADRLGKRSVVLLVSDLFTDVDQLVRGLRRLRHGRHEVVVLQVVDPAEIEFPFQDLARFEGLEGIEAVMADPRGLRKAYQAEFDAFLKRVATECRNNGADYKLLRTDRPLGSALADLLARRLVKR